MKKRVVIIIIAIIVLFVIFSLIFTHPYKKFNIREDNCNVYYEECTCFGSLITMESYPPQYKCNGLNWCKDIDIEECE